MAKNEKETTFPKKYAKVLEGMPEFKEQAEAADPAGLESIIISCEGNIYNVEAEKLVDAKLNAAKDLCKDLSAGYRDCVKAQTAKLKYALFLLESKGKELGSPE